MTVRNVLGQQFLTIGAQSSSEASAELTVTLRLFQFTWVVIAVTVAVLAIGLLLSDFRLRASGYLILLSQHAEKRLRRSGGSTV